MDIDNLTNGQLVYLWHHLWPWTQRSFDNLYEINHSNFSRFLRNMKSSNISSTAIRHFLNLLDLELYDVPEDPNHIAGISKTENNLDQTDPTQAFHLFTPVEITLGSLIPGIDLINGQIPPTSVMTNLNLNYHPQIVDKLKSSSIKQIVENLSNRTYPLYEIFFVDGDNLIGVLDKILIIAPKQVDAQWDKHVIIHLAKNVNIFSLHGFDNRSWCDIIYTNSRVKDAADINLSMLVAYLDVILPKRVVFSLVSQDRFILEVALVLGVMGRSYKRYTIVDKFLPDIVVTQSSLTSVPLSSSSRPFVPSGYGLNYNLYQSPQNRY